ncbi:sporulation protein YunB [Kyrpidia tusciae DSM 2912]|uniref:Sporulation protein YunB n=2 Tax=Kyrpidia TaxID=1129704 RepID=D5WS09_KYRT2|nr:sporulation protein YunB [Kyrpidia tusciae DSM 2912]MBE3552491.1 sporulation protein YunB [Kyrpidia tusciae]
MPMRFGRRFRVGFRRRVPGGRRPFLLVAVGILGFLVLAFYVLDYNIRPVFVDIAKGMARRLATDAINQALVQTVQQGIDYSKLVTLQTDRNGRVIGATLDEKEVLRLQTAVTTRVQAVVDHLSTQQIDVPIGQAMNSSIFSAFGPMIPVAIVPFGTAESEVQQTTREAGINQTIHEVDIQVQARIQILAPFVAEPVDVQTKVPVAYMVLVGEVPQYFFDARGLPFYPPGWMVPATPGNSGSGPTSSPSGASGGNG